MTRVFVQGLAVVASFLLLWLALSQLNWMELLHIEKAGRLSREKLGELVWKEIRANNEEITENSISGPVRYIMHHLCTSNTIDTAGLEIHILEKKEINAFALPGRRMVVNCGLIQGCESEAELAGVIAHELAHMEEGHIMQKLIKEVGLAVLLNLPSGGENTAVLKELGRILSSTSYDRKLEREADMKGTEYLVEASVDYEGLARFLYKLSEEEGGSSAYLNWISTHPDAHSRAERLMNAFSGLEYEIKPMLADSSWQNMKDALHAYACP